MKFDITRNSVKADGDVINYIIIKESLRCFLVNTSLFRYMVRGKRYIIMKYEILLRSHEHSLPSNLLHYRGSKNYFHINF